MYRLVQINHAINYAKVAVAAIKMRSALVELQLDITLVCANLDTMVLAYRILVHVSTVYLDHCFEFIHCSFLWITACPSGTFADGPNLCLPCPDIHHITAPPANTIESCTCKRGYRATKEHGCESTYLQTIFIIF